MRKSNGISIDLRQTRDSEAGLFGVAGADTDAATRERPLRVVCHERAVASIGGAQLYER